MTALDLQSEQYQPTGNVAGQGVRRQLGRPEMDPLALLVREAAQNSWDARRPGADRITFGIDSGTFEPDQLRVLRERVFARYPSNLPFGRLQNDRVVRISVYDRGTSGLGGPTRADQASDAEDPARDFVDFLRNVGQPPDKERGGGTYGYGKAVFYMLSALRTVCVHTRTATGEARFMAAALGDRYEQVDNMFTGRHWWGREASDGIVDPVTGRSADRLARAIGMPGFGGPDKAGTTVTVIAPDLGEAAPGRDRSLRQATGFMGEVLLWYLWPKMIETSSCVMDCELRLDGEELPLVSPAQYPPLEGFVEALRAVHRYRNTGETTDGVRIHEIEHGLYNHRLGVAGAKVSPRSSGQEEGPVPGFEAGFRPVGDTSHHIALLRSPELVVKYLPGPELPAEMLEYSGVFRADDDRDRSFAKAEPPAHDDWVPDSVEDRRQASNVRVALRKLKEMMKRLVEPHLDPVEGSPVMPLGAFARSLGSLLPTTGSGGGEASPERAGGPGDGHGPGDGRGGGGPMARVQTARDPEYGTLEGEPVVRFFFEVQHPDEAQASRIEARPLVALDDGTRIEEDPPQNMSLPEIVRWTGPTGESRPGRTTIEIPNRDGVWSVVLTLPENTTVGVDLSAEPVLED